MNKKVKLDKKILHEAEIQSLSHDGRGITHILNKTTFVDGVLAGEKITCQLTAKKRRYFEAQVIDVLKASPDRTEAPCAHANVCGGCSLQHMSMQAQLSLKQQTLLEQLKHFGQVTPKELLPPLTSITTGYRRKARLGVKFVIKKNKLMVGFREKSTNYLTDLTACTVLHPSVGEHLTDLNDLIASLCAYQAIPQIEVAVGDDRTALIIRHLLELENQDLQKLINFGEKHAFDIYLQPNAPAAIKKLYPNDNNHRLRYTLANENIEFLFHPLDFTQIHLEMNRLMVAQAMMLLNIQPHERVLDLFCGIGNFTLPIAKRAAKVIGIEGSDEMVRRATENAAHNHIQNVEFFAANLEKPNSNVVWLNQPYDKILLDPPRVGAKDMLPFIAQTHAKRIVYVSCNPATLARDAKELVHTYGYTLTQAGIMNMFPHTSHIEAMAVFDKL